MFEFDPDGTHQQGNPSRLGLWCWGGWLIGWRSRPWLCCSWPAWPPVGNSCPCTWSSPSSSPCHLWEHSLALLLLKHMAFSKWFITLQCICLNQDVKHRRPVLKSKQTNKPINTQQLMRKCENILTALFPSLEHW